MRRSRLRSLGHLGLAAPIGVGTLLVAASAFGQGEPPAPLPPPPAPTAAPAPAPAAPAPAVPAPAAPAPAAAPVPPPPPAPAPAPAAAGVSAGVSVDASADVGDEEEPPPDEEEERAKSLHEFATPWGPTGLLHMATAMTGAPGTFRAGMYLDWFDTSDFLCTSDYPCVGPRNPTPVRGDEHNHIGSSAVLSATLFSGFEAYLAARVYANSNTSSSPQLLQVLGDTTFGLKYVRPLGNGVVNVGGGADVLFLNGTGGIGLASEGTSFRLRALSTFALDKTQAKTPLRFHLAFGYLFDNSGALVADVEDQRSARVGTRQLVSRVERYGLGINKVDRFEIGAGVEGLLAQDRVRPFVEYNLALAMNRQDFACPRPQTITGGGTTDGCLGLEGFSAMPSKVTVGARGFPFKGGLAGVNVTAAFDIGTSGTNTFIHEMAPQAPWTLWFGFGLAADAQEKPAKVVEKKVVEKVEVPSGPALGKVRGVVHEQGTNTPIAGAIVSYVGAPLPPLATTEAGVFGDDVEPGTYQYSVKAEGYKDGTCSVTVAAPKKGAAPMGPGASPVPPAPGAAPAPGAPPAPMGAPPAPMGAAPATPPPSATPGVTEVDCALEALPKVGTAVLSIVDADAQTPVSDVTVTIADAAGQNERVLTTDANGVVRAEGLTPGEWTIKIAAEGYFTTKQSFEIKARQETVEKVGIRLRPKDKLVTVDKKEIKIKQQVHFAVDKAVILGDSVALLEEVADVLINTPRIKRIEIQGHTDNTGSKEHNMELSQARAEAVRAFLIKAGVEPSRLEAKGYGQTKPIAPNINEAGRAKNRRVQFVIQEQEPASEAPKGKEKF